MRSLVQPLYTSALRMLTAGRGLPWRVDEWTTPRIDPRCRWIRHAGYEADVVSYLRARIAPGDVCLDVGAHVGSRVRAWRALGARVIAVEPQPDFTRILRLFFGRDDGVTILPQALGARPGTARLGISTATPTVSSLSTDWIDTVATDRSFAKVRWDRSVEVPVTTLDALIATHGEPAFCKIDVEGF